MPHIVEQFILALFVSCSQGSEETGTGIDLPAQHSCGRDVLAQRSSEVACGDVPKITPHADCDALCRRPPLVQVLLVHVGDTQHVVWYVGLNTFKFEK